MYTLCINPTTDGTGTHDPSAALFRDEELVFGSEEERFNRRKHAEKTFPKQATSACLQHCGIELSDVDKVLVSWKPKIKSKYNLRLTLRQPTIQQKAYYTIENVKDYSVALSKIRNNLADIGTPVPPIETVNHHRTHAASAFGPSGFDEALVLSVDGRGETESTVVWRADGDTLERIRKYPFPNSLGAFYSVITVFLGYRALNGEGKVMGLAPYGKRNRDIEEKLRSLIETGVDYDFSKLNHHLGQAVPKLEELFDRPRRSEPGEFTDWEKDLAHVAQKLLEDTVAEIVETYCREEGLNKVALAGGVALNCKMNKRIMDLDVVDDIFVQPVANDAGSAVGAGIIDAGLSNVDEMTTVYWGPGYSTETIKERLEECKLPYAEPENLAKTIAEQLAEGRLIGWFQGRLEMGPRALGHRSILADPRTSESRDRVNEFVKHREEWRPFAPSMLEEAVDEYLLDGRPAPYMIKTFDVNPERKADIQAVLHPADDTTRPQTVREDQNPRYYRLLREFEEITGVPVLLNTSFNDHGEPIVNTPREALKDFFGMGLDLLVLEDIVLEKPSRPTQVRELERSLQTD